MSLRGCALRLALLLSFLLVAACGNGAQPAASGDVITLYTCVNDTTIQPVIKQFEQANPGKTVNLYRAPTGDLNARVAGDVRSGGLKADVIWACDPLTMQNLVNQHLVGGWTPESDIAPDVRTSDYVGVAVLYLVGVTHRGVAAPHSWSDLARPELCRCGSCAQPRLCRLSPGRARLLHSEFGLWPRLLRQAEEERGRPSELPRRRHERRCPRHLQGRDDDCQFGLRRAEEWLPDHDRLAEARSDTRSMARSGWLPTRPGPNG